LKYIANSSTPIIGIRRSICHSGFTLQEEATILPC
jgi:hypothetical protein